MTTGRRARISLRITGSGGPALVYDEGMSARVASAIASVRVLRARQWLHFLPLPAAATAPGAWTAAGLGRLALATAVAAGALGWAYGLNAIADRGSDASVEKNPLVGVRELGAEAVAAVAVAGLLALVGAALLGPVAGACALLSLAAGALYSVGPRAKALPLAGLIVNVLIFLPLLGLMWAPGHTPSGGRGLLAVFVSLLAQNQLIHERADAAEDERAGALTTGRRLGAAGTYCAIAGIAIAGGAISLWLASGTASAAVSVAVLVAGAVAALGGDAARGRRRHRAVAIVGGAILWALGGR